MSGLLQVQEQVETLWKIFTQICLSIALNTDVWMFFWHIKSLQEGFFSFQTLQHKDL